MPKLLISETSLSCLTSPVVAFLTAKTQVGVRLLVSDGSLPQVRTTYLTLSFPMFVSNFQEFVLSLRFAYLANRSGCSCYAGSVAVNPADGVSTAHSCLFGFS